MTDSPSNLPSPVVAPVLKFADLVKLAREVAMDIRPLDTVLKDYHLPLAEYTLLLDNPTYWRVLCEAQKEWNSALTTPERVKLSAAALLEQALPMIGARAGDRLEDLNKVVEAGKLLGKLSQLDGTGPQTGGSEKFSITINTGSGAVRIEAGKTKSGPDEIQPFTEREGTLREVQSLTSPDDNEQPI